MSIDETSDLWWKNAIVYCMDVETFLDTDGDGRGDLEGLLRQVDYLAGIGVTCIWLMPFYPTPNRDDGYDLTDFYGVDPLLGSHGDFVRFLRTARDRGMRVIIDFVINHTSDQHPWFLSARSDPDSPYRDYYVWRDRPPDDEEDNQPVFPDVEDSVWSHDEEAGQYYLHNFYSHQPELNIDNPKVRDELSKIAGFWLQLGVSGFRIDAVQFFLEGLEGVDGGPHSVMRHLRAFVQRRRGDAMLLGEVNVEPQKTRRYFGDENGDELHMLFNFNLNQALYLALVRGDAAPVVETLRALPDIPEEAQWATFVRNHDELTLDRLSESERQEVFEALGPDEDMQLYGRGLRRRLPPMVDGDRRRLELMYSLLFALPGTPVLFYGEEIGMGENLAIDGRLSVRTPMQWTSAPNAGFSSVEPGRLRRPVVEGDYGPRHVNVSDQRRDPESLLNWMERMIRRRKECPELGHGTTEVVDTGEPSVLVLRTEWDGRTLLAVHNFADRPCPVRLPLDEDVQVLVDLVDGRGTVEVQGGAYDLELAPYGYQWFRVRRRGDQMAG